VGDEKYKLKMYFDKWQKENMESQSKLGVGVEGKGKLQF
jgi:hypothetical protein